MRTVDGDHFFFFKQKTAYEMRISDWSSDVCSSDLESTKAGEIAALALGAGVIVPDDLPRLFKLRGSRQTNETPIDELVAAAGTHRLVWQLDKSDPQRRNLVAASLTNVPYIESVTKALRPEELPPGAYDAIWPRG